MGGPQGADAAGSPSEGSAAARAEMILTPDQRVRVFISSTLEELAAERAAAMRAVSRLHLVPRYRQRLAFVPFNQGRPVWVDDPHFNIGFHVRHTALPTPGGEDQLKRLTGRVFSQALDRDRPGVDAITARAYRHDVLDDRIVVRLIARMLPYRQRSSNG